MLSFEILVEKIKKARISGLNLQEITFEGHQGKIHHGTCSLQPLALAHERISLQEIFEDPEETLCENCYQELWKPESGVKAHDPNGFIGDFGVVIQELLWVLTEPALQKPLDSSTLQEKYEALKKISHLEKGYFGYYHYRDLGLGPRVGNLRNARRTLIAAISCDGDAFLESIIGMPQTSEKHLIIDMSYIDLGSKSEDGSLENRILREIWQQNHREHYWQISQSAAKKFSEHGLFSFSDDWAYIAIDERLSDEEMETFKMIANSLPTSFMPSQQLLKAYQSVTALR